eukprot:jgi/Tetstr1/424988/TSEL_015458.t1
MAFESKPRALSCYLCGAQFGSQSLLIHIKTCQKKWLAQEAQKPGKERRALPDPPPELADPSDPAKVAASNKDVSLPTSAAAVDAFNARMLSVWDTASLNSCPHCGRTFTAEPFTRHQKICSAERPFKPLSSAAKGTGGGLDSSPSKSGLSATAPAGSLASSASGDASTGGAAPRTYTCYLCERGFMGRSLGIHLPQCLSKWVANESQREPSKQRAPPMPPPELADPATSQLRAFKDGVAEGVLPRRAADIEAFNKRMGAHWDQASLAGCPKCGRTFNWEALEKHEKGCKGGGGGEAAGQDRSAGDRPGLSTTDPAGPLSANPRSHLLLDCADGSGGTEASSGGGTSTGSPKTYNCYLCGRGFMSRSLGIHLPQCLSKWVANESQREPGKQRAPPMPPPELADPATSQLRAFKDGVAEGVLPRRAADIEAFNKRMGAHWDQASLAGCPKCGRTFNWEALEKHEKGCKGGGSKGSQQQPHPITPPQTKSQPTPAGSASPGPRSYVCFLCGRAFMSKSLGIHLPQCLVKWEADMARRPPRLRRSLPPPPPELAEPAAPGQLRAFRDGVAEGVLPRRPPDIEAFNRRMTAAWEEGSLAPCGGCGRTFNWEALEKHEMGCKAK